MSFSSGAQCLNRPGKGSKNATEITMKRGGGKNNVNNGGGHSEFSFLG